MTIFISLISLYFLPNVNQTDTLETIKRDIKNNHISRAYKLANTYSKITDTEQNIFLFAKLNAYTKRYQTAIDLLH